MHRPFHDAARRSATIGLCLVWCLVAARGRGETPATDLSAFAMQSVHPVLIRNDHNVLLHMVIVANQADGLRVRSLTFDFQGTDAVGDLDSIQLFATGGEAAFSADGPCGEAVAAAETVSIDVDRPLMDGENHFWLSCRLRPDADLSHHVDAACMSVDTTAGAVEPVDRTPGIRHRIGVALRRHNDDGVHTHRIPALTTTPRGTLLCVYDLRRRMSRDLQEDIDIGLSRSTDGGRTWENARVIMDMGTYGGLPPEQNGCSDPGIIVDQVTGDIYCFAVWMWGKPGKHQWTDDGSEPGFEIGKSAQLMMVHSNDDGLTWSEPKNLTRALKKEAWWLLAPSPQQGTNLADGTLVMPAQGRDEQGVPFATLLVSSDHGANWTVAEPAFSGGNECQAVQLGDGSIMLNMRNDHERYRAVYVTSDLGQTWQAHPTNRQTLIEPNCNGSLYRVDYGAGDQRRHVLLFANPYRQQRRTHQTIQVSHDDGVTWPLEHHLLLDEGLGRGYPSITRVDANHIGIVYEGSTADLVFERISLAELLDR